MLVLSSVVQTAGIIARAGCCPSWSMLRLHASYTVGFKHNRPIGNTKSISALFPHHNLVIHLLEKVLHLHFRTLYLLNSSKVLRLTLNGRCSILYPFSKVALAGLYISFPVHAEVPSSRRTLPPHFEV